MRVPLWISAKFASECPQCHVAILKGNRILYFPSHRHAICESCGRQYERDLAADNFDAANNEVL